MNHSPFQGLVLILTLVSLVTCDSRGYTTPGRQGSTVGPRFAARGTTPTLSAGQGFHNGVNNRQSLSSRQQTTGGLTNGGGNGISVPCGVGQVRHVDGNCVVPEISRSLFLYDPPKLPKRPSGRPPVLPPPTIERNIMFVRLPKSGPPEPLIIPPPRQNTAVYVLNKKIEREQKIIELPGIPQSKPEVYFVNYDDGENPALPGGYDLETALNAAIPANGQVIEGPNTRKNNDFNLSSQSPGGREDQIEANDINHDSSNTMSQKGMFFLGNEREDRKTNLIVSRLSPVSVDSFTVSGDMQPRPSQSYG